MHNEYTAEYTAQQQPAPTSEAAATAVTTETHYHEACGQKALTRDDLTYAYTGYRDGRVRFVGTYASYTCAGCGKEGGWPFFHFIVRVLDAEEEARYTAALAAQAERTRRLDEWEATLEKCTHGIPLALQSACQNCAQEWAEQGPGVVEGPAPAPQPSPQPAPAALEATLATVATYSAQRAAEEAVITAIWPQAYAEAPMCDHGAPRGAFCIACGHTVGATPDAEAAAAEVEVAELVREMKSAACMRFAAAALALPHDRAAAQRLMLAGLQLWQEATGDDESAAVASVRAWDHIPPCPSLYHAIEADARWIAAAAAAAAHPS